MSEKIITLKNCPICDHSRIGKEIEHSEYIYNARGLYLYCCSCYLRGPWFSTLEEAADHWNERPCNCSEVNKIKTSNKKACPYCASQAIHIGESTDYCLNCFAEGPAEKFDWNDRFGMIYELQENK